MRLPKKRGVKRGGQGALNSLLPLLLPAARVKINSSQAETLQGAQWVDLARRRCLAPAFYSYLRQGEHWDMLPEGVQENLEVAYCENLASTMARETALTAILEVFKTMGTVPVLLKGLAFATELYPDPAARLAGDVDLLITPELKEEVIRRVVEFRQRIQAVPVATLRPRQESSSACCGAPLTSAQARQPMMATATRTILKPCL